jgi:hypothetical protein
MSKWSHRILPSDYKFLETVCVGLIMFLIVKLQGIVLNRESITFERASLLHKDNYPHGLLRPCPSKRMQTEARLLMRFLPHE